MHVYFYKTLQTSPKKIKLDSTSTVSVRKLITSKQDQEVPLPRPFQLPQNYHDDIMKGLERKKLLGIDKAKFITAIAESIYAYKKNPTKEEYDHVALQIIKKWSFLGDKNGHVRNYSHITNLLSVPIAMY